MSSCHKYAKTRYFLRVVVSEYGYRRPNLGTNTLMGKIFLNFHVFFAAIIDFMAAIMNFEFFSPKSETTTYELSNEPSLTSQLLVELKLCPSVSISIRHILNFLRLIYCHYYVSGGGIIGHNPRYLGKYDRGMLYL